MNAVIEKEIVSYIASARRSNASRNTQVGSGQCERGSGTPPQHQTRQASTSSRGDFVAPPDRPMPNPVPLPARPGIARKSQGGGWIPTVNNLVSSPVTWALALIALGLVWMPHFSEQARVRVQVHTVWPL